MKILNEKNLVSHIGEIRIRNEGKCFFIRDDSSSKLLHKETKITKVSYQEINLPKTINWFAALIIQVRICHNSYVWIKTVLYTTYERMIIKEISLGNLPTLKRKKVLYSV